MDVLAGAGAVPGDAARSLSKMSSAVLVFAVAVEYVVGSSGVRCRGRRGEFGDSDHPNGTDSPSDNFSTSDNSSASDNSSTNDNFSDSDGYDCLAFERRPQHRSGTATTPRRHRHGTAPAPLAPRRHRHGTTTTRVRIPTPDFISESGTKHPVPPETPPTPVETPAESDTEPPATHDGDGENDADEQSDESSISVDSDSVAFSDLARAAYCPRQLYYRRRDTPSVPDDVTAVMDLAFRYPELRAMTVTELAAEPISVSPETFHDRLENLASRADWDALADPPERDVFLAGKDCHGIAYKILPGVDPSDGDDEADPKMETEPKTETDPKMETDPKTETDPPPVPVIVSPGEPHEHGVWGPQSVRAVAVAKALAWERNREIPRALVEYPAHGTVRSVRLTVRRTADYRRALHTARGIDGPPPRLRNSPKCDPCPYREQCGVETRSLRSRLGL